MASLQQIGGDAGHKDEQEGYNDELKTEAGIVWRTHGKRQRPGRDQQRRRVAEVARARPAEICDEGDRQGQHQCGSALSQLRQHLTISLRHGVRLPRETEERRMQNPLRESARPKKVRRVDKENPDAASHYPDRQRGQAAGRGQVKHERQSGGHNHNQREL